MRLGVLLEVNAELSPALTSTWVKQRRQMGVTSDWGQTLAWWRKKLCFVEAAIIEAHNNIFGA